MPTAFRLLTDRPRAGPGTASASATGKAGTAETAGTAGAAAAASAFAKM